MGKGPEETFSQDVEMADRSMKRCLPSLVTGRMQRKVTMSHHLTLVRMATIQKARDWRGFLTSPSMRGKGNLYTRLVGT